ncbi:MAG: RluA family pseudouridine synthase [Oscillospiraceae bacterium]|nr:RluA family pseudouridine synthase [Oscillospiraceae bacterium]
MNELKVSVEQEYEGERLDKFLSLLLKETSRSAIQRLIENGSVTVNEKSVSKNYRVSVDDEVLMRIGELRPPDTEPENIPIDIIYEDNDLLVVNKPRGMVVHPAPGNYSGTLVNALLYHCKDSLSGINGVLRPGIVHRIDKDTSGLLIVAKNDIAHMGLAEQIKEHSFTREYNAVVCGKMKNEIGTVNAPIGRNPKDRKKMCVTEHNSKSAVTHYSVINEYNGYSHLALRLETGRTHQIRVHMAYIGHPVAGDPVYGNDKKSAELHGQCLHAIKIGFVHPVSGEYLEFTTDLPDYFKNFINKISKGEKNAK